MELNDWEVRVYYDPSTDLGKSTIAVIKSFSNHINEIDVTKNPPNARLLQEILDIVGTSHEALINKNSDIYQEKYSDVELSRNDWLKALEHNPSMLRTPIALRGKRGVIITNPSQAHYIDPQGSGFADAT